MTYDVFSNVDKFNPVACTDSYKWSHPFLMCSKVFGMTAYIEPRVENKTVIMFGLQAWIKKYLLVPIEQWMIDEVEHDLSLHGLPFDKPMWQTIVDNYKFLPISISAVPEGMPIPSRNALITVTAEDGALSEEHFKSLVGWVETSLLRAVWYGTTIASDGYERRKTFEAIWREAGADMAGLDFAYHDFAGRGVTCNEQAENGGMAHLLNFRGTDTFECLRAIRRWYPDGKNPGVSGFSVWAGEHNIALSFGTSEEKEREYLKHMIEVVKTNEKCKILSFVIDTVDWQKCVEKVMSFKNDILELHQMGKKLVLRPDCYAEGTKILTKNGWIDFSEVTSETFVAQVDDNNNMTFTTPQKVIKQFYEGEMIKFCDGKGKLNLLVTPNHRMIYNRKNYTTGEVKNVVEFAEDFDSFYDYVSIDRSAKNVNGANALTFEERLKIAFQADGSPNNGFFGIRFNLKKQRKIDRLTWILENLPYEYKIYDLADGRKEFNVKFEFFDGDKDFAWVNPMEYNYMKAREFIEELSHWDAHRRSDTRFKYDNSNKNAIDVVELICMAAGYGCLISEYDDVRSDKFSKVYTANILLNNKIGGQSITKTTVNYSGIVYCVTVPTGKIIVKKDRGTAICGNSGDMQVTVPWIINKLIDTFGYTLNSKGLKIPAMVGVIQGDGVDTLSAVCLMRKLISMGICPSSIVFGSGGALLQKVSRDDKSFAMKGSAFLTDDGWHGCQKLTPGKKSKMGLLITIKTGGEIKTIDLLSDEVPEDAEIITRKVYENGSLLIDESFEEIRARAHA